MAGATDKVGIVFVSHSVKIAEGLVELARQMAAGVSLVPAGGTDEGGIGTSYEKVSAGIEAADSGAGVVVLCDLGSAILTAETAMDFLDDEVRARVRLVNAPLVEGGVAAAVAAEVGGDLDVVSDAAVSAAQVFVPELPTTPSAAPAGEAPSDRYSRSVTLRNKAGLHARPAAEFVKLASTFSVPVTVNGKDARSLLGIMSLGLNKGAVAEISSDAPDGTDAVNALADLVETGFGEE